jgi:hypothetical protein
MLIGIARRIERFLNGATLGRAAQFLQEAPTKWLLWKKN